MSQDKALLIVFILVSLFLVGCSESKSSDLVDSTETEQPPQTVQILPTEEPMIIEKNWEEFLGDVDGCIVFFDPKACQYQIYNSEMAEMRFSPCSTFKIISALLGLEYQVISPENSTREWSGETFWNDSWNKDVDFTEAFHSSCVWYFREVIDELGADILKQELEALSYGNCDISDWSGHMYDTQKSDSLAGFWIESSLLISPKEQTEVMARIFENTSSYSEESLALLSTVMAQDESFANGWQVYGKTGFGKRSGGKTDAWFVGFAKKNGQTIYFCVYEGSGGSTADAKEVAGQLLELYEFQ